MPRLKIDWYKKTGKIQHPVYVTHRPIFTGDAIDITTPKIVDLKKSMPGVGI